MLQDFNGATYHSQAKSPILSYPIPSHSIPSFDTTKKKTFHLPHSSSVLLPILIEKALTSY